MAWHDDSWKDSYDSWKLASPDDERDEECLHEDYEADINGRAACCHCSYVWWLTDDEIKHERERAAAFDQMMRREERRDRIQRVVHRITWMLWRRWRKPLPVDDDLPF